MLKKIKIVILMAGSSSRMNLNYHKVLYYINNKPLFLYSLDKFLLLKETLKQEVKFDITLVIAESDFDEVKDIVSIDYQNEEISFLIGGVTRQESVKKALSSIKDVDYVLLHDAARPLFEIDDVNCLIEEIIKYENNICGSLCHNITDTTKIRVNDQYQTVDRESLLGITTPQIFSFDLVNIIINNQKDVTDEISIFDNTEVKVIYQKESCPNLKVTTQQDLAFINFYLTKKQDYRIGHSLDYHPFTPSRPLILSGVKIPYDWGLAGHSDADVVYHSLTEALLGAMSLGDIGTYFSDNDDKYLNIDSSYFVKEIKKMLDERCYQVVNVDIMIYIEKPNLKLYKPQMVNNIKTLLDNPYVSIKATTMEKTGVIGTSQGIAVETVVLIVK